MELKMKQSFTVLYKKRIGLILIAICILFSKTTIGQSSIDSVIASVLKNNKSIQANFQYLDSRKLFNKTQIFPDNPRVEYDYLKGSPENAGNQTEITVSQSFDFPTVYGKKRQLSDLQSSQAELQFISSRQDVLMETKMVCIELVYRNKLQKEYEAQLANMATILKNFEIKLDKGNGNILEVNKARLQLIAFKGEYLQNASVINQLNVKLVSLNGGIAIEFSDTVYFILPSIPPFDELESQNQAADPRRKSLEQERVVAQKEIELSRALAFPKFEAGYHYQGILGQKYNGIHTGISIPLWENNNKVKLQKSNFAFTELIMQDHKTDQYFKFKQLYNEYQNLKIILSEYQNTLFSLNTYYLLNKALDSGSMTSTEYFTEINYYADAFNSYLKVEKAYYEAIAKLYKFTL